MPESEVQTPTLSSTTSATMAPVQFTYQIQTKLTSENFLIWKMQVMPVIIGHGLTSYLEGAAPPPPFLTSTDGIVSANPAFEPWQRQDQLLLAWLISSLSSSLLPLAVSCRTSADLWAMLYKSFETRSQARVLDLKLQLQHIKKGSLTGTDYVNRIRSIADQLSAIGHAVSNQDLLLYAFSGLGDEYLPLVTSLTTSPLPISLDDFHGHLVTFEARLSPSMNDSVNIADLSKKGTDASSQHSTPSVSLDTSQTNTGLGPQVFSTLVSNLPVSTQQQFAAAFLAQQLGRGTSYGGRGRGRRGGYGRGRGRAGSNPVNTATQGGISAGTKPKESCQICGGTSGHTAKDCWYRYDDDVTPPQVNLAQSCASPTEGWFLDSGASSHITPDLNALTNYTPFQGSDVVRVGNGAGLSISNLGSSSLLTSKTNINLQQVLHVPSMTKNLISISKLTRDNNVVVEFTKHGCFIKDPMTQEVLLEGDVYQGLYYISPHSSLLSETSRGDLWHHRLAHSSPSVLQHLHKEKLINFSTKNLCCVACNQCKSHKLPFNFSDFVASKPLELVHVDVWGPSPTVSSIGNKYYLIIVDDFSRFSWLFPFQSKTQVVTIFTNFKARVENLLSTSIKSLQCDGGT